jgi:hypothetical protein
MAASYAWLVGEKTIKSIPSEAKEKISIITGIVMYQPKTITYEIGEWRSYFSAIHQWMTSHGASLADKERLIYKSELQELYKIILQILEDKSLASKLLPVRNSWLSYLHLSNREDYDDQYFCTLRKTRDIITPIISAASSTANDFSHFVYTWND